MNDSEKMKAVIRAGNMGEADYQKMDTMCAQPAFRATLATLLASNNLAPDELEAIQKLQSHSNDILEHQKGQGRRGGSGGGRRRR